MRKFMLILLVPLFLFSSPNYLEAQTCPEIKSVDGVSFICPPRPALQPPVISGVNGPISLSVDQVGTWIVTAYNPNGGSLSYSVNWGDGLQLVTQDQSSITTPEQVPIFANFTHSYAKAGTYIATLTVTNVFGLSAKASLGITVEGTVSSPAPIIYSIIPAGCTSLVGFSPLTGEICTSSRLSADFGEIVYLYGANFSNTSYGTYVVTYSTINNSYVAIPTTFVASNLLRFVIPANAGSGQHTIFVKKTDDDAFASNMVNLNFVGVAMTTSIFNPSPVPTSTPAPGKLSISSLSKLSGPVGAEVTIYGTGFTTSGNNILSRDLAFASNISSSDGSSLTFKIPSSAGYYCEPNALCPEGQTSINGGTVYDITVLNASGVSNVVEFTVTD